MNIEQDSNINHEADQRTVTIPFSLFVEMFELIAAFEGVEEEFDCGNDAREMGSKLKDYMLQRCADKDAV